MTGYCIRMPLPPDEISRGCWGGGRDMGVIAFLSTITHGLFLTFPWHFAMSLSFPYQYITDFWGLLPVIQIVFFFFNLLRAGKACGVCECRGREHGGDASGWQVWWPLRTKPLQQGIIHSIPCEPSFMQREQDQICLFCALSLPLGISGTFCSPVNTTVVPRKPTHKYSIACHLQHCGLGNAKFKCQHKIGHSRYTKLRLPIFHYMGHSSSGPNRMTGNLCWKKAPEVISVKSCSEQV